MIWELPEGATVIERTDREEMKKLAPDCRWWTVSYDRLSFSIYYDPTNSLGYNGGKPYYEIYHEEVYRFDEKEDLFVFIENACSKLDRDLIEVPENFL